ncbi:MAG: hypothetical protein DMF61_14630 [Blastocatellia bacterium AA13]|nr:MAG: hypothetical protein DMF61_14630 [Blastocatellia bacterium AA13]
MSVAVSEFVLNNQFRRIIRAGLRAYYCARHTFGLKPRSERETDVRLARFTAREQRYRPGRFSFPFGPISYVDGPSLRYQFQEIFVQKCYDFNTAETAPVIIDCGGNVGMSVIRFKQLYPEATVTVIEADPEIAAVLRRNISSLNLTHVSVINAAAWNRDGEVSFNAEHADGGRVDESQSSNRVMAIRLADLINEPVDMLKMDIEGAEYSVIRDLCQSGKVGLVRRLACEIHGRDDKNDRLGDLLSILTAAGLRLTFNFARSAPDMPGNDVPTPFSAVPDGKYLLHLYAWRP